VAKGSNVPVLGTGRGGHGGPPLHRIAGAPSIALPTLDAPGRDGVAAGKAADRQAQPALRPRWPLT